VGADVPHESLLAIAKLVAARLPEEEVFAAVAERVAHASAVEAAAVLRYLGDERAVVVGSWREGGPRGMPVNAELDFDVDASALGRVRATGRPARVNGYHDGDAEFALVMNAAGLRATVAVPVRVEERTWGAIVASSARDGDPFAATAEDVLLAFAELVTLTVINGELDRHMAQVRLELLSSADASRSQLDRDLHAGPQQHLAALAVNLRLAAAAAGDGEVGDHIEAAAAELVEARASLQEIGRGLHPAVLRERGLSAAVLALAARSRVPVSLRELPGRRFAPAIEATAYFIVSEALRNTADHAEAEQAFVVVGDRGVTLSVEVSDDGRGGADPARGAGLRAISQRITALGGRLEIDSPPGAGTTVRAELRTTAP
jgi:signal transduction histidine kinase